MAISPLLDGMEKSNVLFIYFLLFFVLEALDSLFLVFLSHNNVLRFLYFSFIFLIVHVLYEPKDITFIDVSFQWPLEIQFRTT